MNYCLDSCDFVSRCFEKTELWVKAPSTADTAASLFHLSYNLKRGAVYVTTLSKLLSWVMPHFASLSP